MVDTSYTYHAPSHLLGRCYTVQNTVIEHQKPPMLLHISSGRSRCLTCTSSHLPTHQNSAKQLRLRTCYRFILSSCANKSWHAFDEATWGGITRSAIVALKQQLPHAEEIIIPQPAGMPMVQWVCPAGGPPSWGNATGTLSPTLPPVNGTLTSKAPRSSAGKPQA